MASTDQRTGFRFGWGSSKGDGDKAAEQPRDTGTQGASDGSASAQETPQASGDPTQSREAQVDHSWPVSDVGAVAPTAGPAPESHASGFLSELMRAMQAAAEQTRKQIMDRFADEARMHVDGIRSRSGEDLNELRRGADADVSSIREWSKAEIARIKAETDERIATRRTQLERQVEGHGALVDREVEKFQAQVAAFEQQMDGFFARIQQVADPSTFAAVAQGMPEPPQIESLGVNARSEALAEAPIEAAPSITGSSWDAPTGSASGTETSTDQWQVASPSPEPASGAAWAGGPAPATIDDWSGGSSSATPASPGAWSESSAAPASPGMWSETPAAPAADSSGNRSRGDSGTAEAADTWKSSWNDSPSGTADRPSEPEPASAATTEPASGPDAAWGDTSSPSRFESSASSPINQPRDGDPIVYGAPASLAAEALSSGWDRAQPAESVSAATREQDGGLTSPPAAEQPPAGSDFSFSADARLAALGINADLSGAAAAEAEAASAAEASMRSGLAFEATEQHHPEPTPPAPAPSTSIPAGSAFASGAPDATVSIPGQAFDTGESVPPDESSAARLAGLVPSSELPANGRTPGAQPIPTQVIVTGLLSVASIAAFKRQLSRIPGVQAVGVSSGPDGEFIFKTTHEPGVALAALIPALPGFGAEVVNAGEGTIQVAAHDPEADA
jgi:hypothetical protein